MFLDKFEKLEIPFPGVRLPKVQIPEEDYKKYKLSKEISNMEFLKGICRIGYKERLKNGEIDKSRAKEYGERINEELSLLEELGFIDYILLVWDVINFCRKNDIPVGPGRGSCCGSLVCYLSGITQIDSIKYELYFARFVSKARAKSTTINGIKYLDGSLVPDIDNDICCYRRTEVINYLKKKYPNRFCKLSTQMTLSTRVLIKECGKIVENYSDDKMTQVSSTIPSLFGKVHDIDKAIEESEKFASFVSGNKRILKIAKKLHGLIKHKGSHASAFMISYYDLSEFMPCELGSDNEIVSCPDMEYSQIEAIKLDLLGLDSVTLVESILKRINIDIHKINLDDDYNIYKHLQNFESTYGIFQLSGESVVRAIKKIKPQNILDVSAITSLIRPGASQFIDDYANGIEVPFKNKILKDILKETNGVTLFQEQQLAIANKVFGLELSEAETLRRIIGKKKISEMAVWKPRIFEQAEKLKLEDGLADWFWNILQASASYSFNKCLDPNSIILTNSGNKNLKDIKIGDDVVSFDFNFKKRVVSTVINIYKQNADLYRYTMNNGMELICSPKHKVMVSDGEMKEISTIVKNDYEIICL